MAVKKRKKRRQYKKVQPKKRLLAAYAKTGNVTIACLAAKVSRNSHYRWLETDPTYQKAFDLAQREADDYLEAEARRRALDGIDEPVIYQGELMGEKVEYNDTPEKNHFIPLTVKKYSDTLLIFLMKGARPEKYRDNHRHEISGPGGKPIETKDVLREQLRKFSTIPAALTLARQAAEIILTMEKDDDSAGS